ncbi:MAG TPA: YceH family protein [Myxococcota bacterium]|nr:YceH family protein [Myxococcota bacterium]
MATPLPALSLLETRVLGVLVEKQHTVPDTYPLTLNALVAGANQRTSRDPVIEATEGEVQAAVDHLKSLSLVVESSGGRVMRYAQNAGKVLGIPPQSVALLAVLFLRGPQTAGELRINSERLHRFGDILSVEAFLHELAERPLVKELAKLPGARETRWVHLLSGEPAAEVLAAASPAPSGGQVTVSELAAIKANVDHLQGEVAALRDTVARLCRELGITP